MGLLTQKAQIVARNAGQIKGLAVFGRVLVLLLYVLLWGYSLVGLVGNSKTFSEDSDITMVAPTNMRYSYALSKWHKYSLMGTRTATIRTTTTSMLGLFNHLTIYPFNNLKFISLFSISIVKDYAI